MRNHVLLAAGIFDVSLEQREIKQISHPQAPAAHFVFVSRPDAARGCANLHPARGVFRSQFNHAVIGQDHMGAIAHKQTAIYLHAIFAQARTSLRKAIGSSTTPLPMTLRHPARNTPQGTN